MLTDHDEVVGVDQRRYRVQPPDAEDGLTGVSPSVRGAKVGEFQLPSDSVPMNDWIDHGNIHMLSFIGDLLAVAIQPYHPRCCFQVRNVGNRAEQCIVMCLCGVCIGLICNLNCAPHFRYCEGQDETKHFNVMM